MKPSTSAKWISGILFGYSIKWIIKFWPLFSRLLCTYIRSKRLNSKHYYTPCNNLWGVYCFWPVSYCKCSNLENVVILTILTIFFFFLVTVSTLNLHIIKKPNTYNLVPAILPLNISSSFQQQWHHSLFHNTSYFIVILKRTTSNLTTVFKKEKYISTLCQYIFPLKFCQNYHSSILSLWKIVYFSTCHDNHVFSSQSCFCQHNSS